MTKRLLELVVGGGCARKLPAESLLEVLAPFMSSGASAAKPHPWTDDTAGPLDDAATVTPSLAPGGKLVMTVDILTPMVDEPRLFGAIAAANAISDVYAMGGKPEVALSFIGFPSGELPLSDLSEIIAGMREVCDEVGCAIVGGHTIVDAEPKAGLAVTGTVDGARVWSHRAGKVGQALVLSKALGVGISVGAMKRGDASPEITEVASKSMRRTNRDACEAGLAHGVTAATDITGFGLLGHLKNLCEASGVVAQLSMRSIPIFPGVRELAEKGLVPGGSKKNLAFVEPIVRFHASLSDAERLLLADAQTSGGLLMATSADQAEPLAAALRATGHAAAVIGRLVPKIPEDVTATIVVDP